MASVSDKVPDRKKFINDFEWATKKAKLCANRVWAVAGHELPKLLPPEDKMQEHVKSMELGNHASGQPANHLSSSIEYTNAQLENHEMCTVEFCEYSQRDFTGVEQRHECRKKKCASLHGLFSRDTLDRAARLDESTVWSLDGQSILERPRPYMAISHVWSDGTGAGSWPKGEVNECLYGYFKRIAQQFQCEGIWWDTLCFPKEKAARERALRRIQSNYENARITLVHDCFLRNWKWDRDTACFAILMSPWFSRGWNALELVKSRKVKVIFKGFYGPIIKDLDEDILSKPGESGPHAEASKVIRKLRKPATSINSLLTILGPRHMSQPKDRPIIAAHLMGVQLPKGTWQWDIYKRILKETPHGRISPGHLFHNSATTSQGSWFPASLFDMPVVDEPEAPLDAEKAYLRVNKDLSLDGEWKCLVATEIREKEYNWRGIHPFAREKLQLHLQENVEPHRQGLGECSSFLLFESIGYPDRALLVKKLSQGKGPPSRPCFEYIGAVFFSRPQPLSQCATQEVKLLGDTISSGTTSQAENAQTGNNPGVSKKLELHSVIWRGDHERFLTIIEKVDLDLPDELGNRPLHLASERGDAVLVRSLLERKNMNRIIIDAQCKLGQTALHRACWGGSVVTVDLLLRHGADATIADHGGNHPIHVAAEKGFESVVKRIMNDSDCTAKNRNGITPLHFAAWSGQESIFHLLVGKPGVEIEVEDKYGWTPLHYAAGSGQAEIVKYLLEKGACVDKRDSKVGWTPLHFAEFNAHEGVVELLCEWKIDIEVPDEFRWTPKQLAALMEQSESKGQLASNQQWAVAEPLPDQSASPTFGLASLFMSRPPEILEDKCWTPLHCTAVNERQMVAKLLLDEDVDSAAKEDWMVLFWAAKRGQQAVVRLLINNGANVNLLDSSRRTPLSWAAESGHIVVVQILLESGADVDIKEWGDCSSLQGFTPLLRAARNGHDAVVSLLHKKGADIKAALFKAIDYSDAAAVKLLLETGLVDVNLEYAVNVTLTETPLTAASSFSNSAAVVKVLLDSGADVELPNSMGQRPLYLAAETGNLAVIELLLEKDANINGTHPHIGDTALFNATRCDKLAAVNLLLEKGADTNLTGYGGQTALSVACKKEKLAIIELLLNKGADTSVAINGETPLEMAIKVMNLAAVKLLLDKGASVEDWTLFKFKSSGQLPSFLAHAFKSEPMIELIRSYPASPLIEFVEFYSASLPHPTPPSSSPPTDRFPSPGLPGRVRARDTIY